MLATFAPSGYCRASCQKLACISSAIAFRIPPERSCSGLYRLRRRYQEGIDRDLTSQDFNNVANYRGLVKTPLEFVVSLHRNLVYGHRSIPLGIAW